MWARAISFLRDIGKHFSVNKMIKAEAARLRLERDQGYSFIEFNYHLLQSYDFLHLARSKDCFLQVGGDDQWFHFCGGIELIRREMGKQAFAFTIPLLTTSDGKKMGKTEKGALWIDENKVNAYDYYQYWVNVTDEDVIRFMKLFTFLPMEEIAEYEQLRGAAIREAEAEVGSGDYCNHSWAAEGSRSGRSRPGCFCWRYGCQHANPHGFVSGFSHPRLAESGV